MNHFSKILSKLQNGEEETVFDELIGYAEKEITPEEIAELAKVLASSGTLLQISTSNTITDIPSTGGPSSLSTLLTPLFLKQFGFVVPKLGVSGRPAGGIDILAQIEKFDINPDHNTLKDWLAKSSYVHFIGGEQYAPLDRKLFEFRKKKAKVDVLSLVVASILSKKIAVGLQRTGLDIRVSEFGNFGKSWQSARENAELFQRVAAMVDINAICFLTNAGKPFQPYIGRGEALLAMKKIFSGKGSPWLMNHVYECFSMAKEVAGQLDSDSAENSLDIKKLQAGFFENIELQGGTVEEFEKLTKKISSGHQFHHRSDKEGFVKIDLHEIRSAMVEIQFKSNVQAKFADPCGLILNVNQGDLVRQDTMLCSYRCDVAFQNEFQQKLRNAISVVSVMGVPYQFEKVN